MSDERGQCYFWNWKVRCSEDMQSRGGRECGWSCDWIMKCGKCSQVQRL